MGAKRTFVGFYQGGVLCSVADIVDAKTYALEKNNFMVIIIKS